MPSCSTQNLFQGGSLQGNVDSLIVVSGAKDYQHIIGIDDKVSISVWNNDDLSIGSIYGVHSANEVNGKWLLVNPEGEVNLPLIGNLKLEGLTQLSASDTIAVLLSKYIKNPIVTVRVLNYEVTILGEVKQPGNYQLEKDRNTITELIGKAGGFTFYAKKQDIRLVRGKGVKAREYILDLTNIDPVKLNQVVLHPGDIIYIPARKGKQLDKKSSAIVSVSSLITTVLLVMSAFNNR